MSISAVGGGSSQVYQAPTAAAKPATPAKAPPPAVKTDSDGDHDGDKGPKGNTIDVKA